MGLPLLDLVLFGLFIACVVGVSLWFSRKEKGSEDYFLAGRSLTWPLVGLSLVASNISTEHFVGMAGEGFGSTGLAIASYEWIAAYTLLAVAFLLLPLYLRLGITTMPEFLERRFGPVPRSIFAGFVLVFYVGVGIASVLYSGAVGLATIFDVDLMTGIWSIGLIAGLYTIYGGLKAVVWSDVLQGSVLILGGLVVSFLALDEAGGWTHFMERSGDKMHMALPADHPDLPWTALLLGIWIPNFFYWGCNQFITQRTLGSRDLRQGQLGIVLAAWLKLLMPFLVVVPGIIAFQLYGASIEDGDQAYAVLVRELLPTGLRGVFLAALFGAVMSSLDSMLNSASTIFTWDLYGRWLRPDADSRRLMQVGRIATAVFVVVGCLLAPLPASDAFEGVFQYIQMLWGFISPGVVVVFLFGLFTRRKDSAAATVGLLGSVVLYGAMRTLWPEVAFLNHMAFSFLILAAVVGAMFLRPSAKLLPAVDVPPADALPVRHSRAAIFLGLAAAVATTALYITFW